jgi:hypothetical protein
MNRFNLKKITKGRKILTTLKASTALKVAYVILLATTFFYVKGVLSTDSFKAAEKVVEGPAVKRREVTVHLVVENGQEAKKYQAKLLNIDTVEDFLRDLRNKQGLYYEKDLYTYGAEIVSVFDKEADSSKKWAVLLDNKDITNKIAEEYLVDHTTYTLKQIDVLLP